MNKLLTGNNIMSDYVALNWVIIPRSICRKFYLFTAGTRYT